MKVTISTDGKEAPRAVTLTAPRMVSNAAMLEQLLGRNGQYLVTIHNGKIAKLVYIPREEEIKADDLLEAIEKPPIKKTSRRRSTSKAKAEQKESPPE